MAQRVSRFEKGFQKSFRILAPWCLAKSGCFFVGLALLLSGVISAAAAPANDSFAQAILITNTPAEVTGDTTDASLEKGEKLPVKGMAGASLWYEWIAPCDGQARLLATSATFVPVIAVYQGSSLAKLKMVVNSLATTNTLAVHCVFAVTAGKKYCISLDGRQSDGRGQVVLTLDLTTLRITNPVMNSRIEQAPAPPFSINTPIVAADGVLQSVSYVGFAPGLSTMLLLGSTTNPPFSIVPTNLVVGQMLLLAVATNSEGRERVSLPSIVRVSPANDLFTRGFVLAGYEWIGSGYTTEATREIGELGKGDATVWWHWTAPASGTLKLTTWLGEPKSPQSTRSVAVYIGSDVKHLQAAPGVVVTKVLGSPSLTFPVTEGVSYHIQVAAAKSSTDSAAYPFILSGRMETLAFTSPTGQSFTEPTNVLIALHSTELASEVDRMEIYDADGYTNQLLQQLVPGQWSFIWSNAPTGDHTLAAKLIKNSGPNPLTASTTVSIRPLNDAFTNAIGLTTNLSWLSHRIAGATRESGEPVHNGNQYASSAWWRWTAITNGIIYLSDPTGKTSPGAAMYAGTNLSSLQSLALGLDPVYHSNLVAAVSHGVVYQFALTPGATPEANLQLRFYPPPPNDLFRNRIMVSGEHADLSGYTVGATHEGADPNSPSWWFNWKTVWWSWTAPHSGLVTLQQQAGYWIYGGIYTGNTQTSLSPVRIVESFADPTTLEVKAGTTYHVEVGSYWGDEESVGISLDLEPTPTNDTFAVRTLLVGTNLQFTVSNGGATTELGEPAPAPGGSGRTLWWDWTAPVAGNVYVTAQLSVAHPRGSVMLQLFKGDDLGALTLLPEGQPAIATESANAPVLGGQTLHLRLDTTSPDLFPIHLEFIPAPTNDLFANASILTGTNFDVVGTARGASGQTNEPDTFGNHGNSVWYAWTAPRSGSHTVVANQAGENCWLGAYVGTNLASLSHVGLQYYHDAIILNAQAGTTYYFAVSAFPQWEPNEPDLGGFHLQLLPFGLPTNDHFETAQWLYGTNDVIDAFNWSATLDGTDPMLVQWRNLKRTLWYQWQVPASGVLRFIDQGSTVPLVMGTFRQTNVNDLRLYANIGGSETPVRAGELLHFLVDGDLGMGGEFKLQMNFTPAPTNDDIELAAPITGTNALMNAYVWSATGDIGGDRNRFDYRDVWWVWTPPDSGHVVISNLQTTARPVFMAFAGTNPTNLQLLAYASLGEPSLEFEASPTNRYYIRGTWGPGNHGDQLALLLTETLTQPDALLLPSSSPTAAPAANFLSPEILLSSPRLLPGGGFAFEVNANVLAELHVEWSVDLIRWQTLATGALTNRIQTITDFSNLGAVTRFYRVATKR